ncbi:MAG: hemerythrin domain-containing protein [Nevskiales bacterium]|nr:hemerythrin domain-containing protein [Nevskiales bacterium]
MQHEPTSAAARTVEPTRYDTYRRIHRALRAAMAQTLVELGRVDPDDAGTVDVTLDATIDLLEMCNGHLEHENDFIHAAMEARRPGSAHKTAADHDQHLRSIEALGRDVARVRASSGACRARLLDALYLNLSSFVAENFEHMLVEESYNNAVLWDCYSDAEIIAIESALTGSIPDHEKAAVIRHMVPAIGQPERLELLSHLRQAMPAEAFTGLLTGLLPQIPAADRERLAAALA